MILSQLLISELSSHAVVQCHIIYGFNTVHLKFLDILLVGFAVFGEDIIRTVDIEILILCYTFFVLSDIGIPFSR